MIIDDRDPVHEMEMTQALLQRERSRSKPNEALLAGLENEARYWKKRSLILIKEEAKSGAKP